MLVLELSLFQNSTKFINYAPFTFRTKPGARVTADYWTTTFGAADDNSAKLLFINAAILNGDQKLNKVNSVDACIFLIGSFYFDYANQELFIHPSHDTYMPNATAQVGVGLGLTNSDVVSIGGIQFDPLILSAPNISKKADLVNYNKPAFLTGSIEVSNVGGFFDDIIDFPIYGNTVDLYYIPGSCTDCFERDDMVPLATYYVEDYDFSLSRLKLNVQDPRKADNKKILTTMTVRNEFVPLIYGRVRYCKLLLNETDGTTGNVTYRSSELLTALGTVQVFNDTTKKWSNVTPASSDLATGAVVLSATNGRTGGASDGTPLEARLYLATGIGGVSANSLTVIKDLNLRINGVPYTSDFYDTVEVDAAELFLSTIGVVFNQNIELFEAIRQLQNGSNIGFRYELNATGKRTVRIDRFDSATVADISWFDIKDNLTLNVTTDSSIFFARAIVNYSKDFNDGKYLSVINDDYVEGAIEKYKQAPTITVDTFLTNSTDADSRAEWTAERYSTIRPIASIELHGQQYYTLRIYDLINIDLSTESRLYFGNWKAQIISVEPQYNGLSNKIKAILIERV